MLLNNHLFSVTELNEVIKEILEASFSEIKIEGEISNFRPASSGHWYFSLKDNDSMISAVMFKNNSLYINFKPEDGMKVKVTGKISLYPQRGTYQIVITHMEIFGEGELLALLEKRKRILAQKGYFDASRKKMIPKFPKAIGIVTSPTGAAVKDILKVLERRKNIARVIILPSLVQGQEAGLTIAKQIYKANKMDIFDVLVVTRGGGSIEDLLPFSSDEVVEAIYKSEIPIISAVGHEIDTSFSDLAADLRAATPSAAAEILTEGSQTISREIYQSKERLISSMNFKLSLVKSKLSIFNRDYVKHRLYGILENYLFHIDNLKRELLDRQKTQLFLNKSRIDNSKSIILSLSPLALLERGYSWVTINNKSISDIKISVGDEITIKYKNGELTSEVKEVK